MCLPEYRYTYSVVAHLVWGFPFQMYPYLSLNIFEHFFFFSEAQFLTDVGIQRCYLLHSSLYTARSLPKQGFAVQPDIGIVACSLTSTVRKA